MPPMGPTGAIGMAERVLVAATMVVRTRVVEGQMNGIAVEA